MGFDLFERKRLVFDELMKAVETIKKLSPELAPDERLSFLIGLQEILAEPAEGVSMPTGKLQYDSPAAAVRALLTANPRGLKAHTIVNSLLGKVQTDSAEPKTVL